MQAAPGGEADGERQGGRRRNRRGGRGRDRDDTGGTEAYGQAPGNGEVQAVPSEAATRAPEADGLPTHAEAGEASIEDAGNPSDTRGEGPGNRRRRGGRGRDRLAREDSPEGDIDGAARAEAATEERPLESTGATAAPSPVDRTLETASSVEDAAPAISAHVPEPRHPAEVERAAAPAVTPIGTGVPAPAPEPESYVLPLDSLLAVAEGAGLQWVNSDADKIRATQEAMAALPTAIHVPREIRKVARVDEGPLVLVETRKDLSQVRLPFETQAPQA
jgi:ribonuclease E